MCARKGIAILALAILILLAVPMILNLSSYPGFGIGVLSASGDPAYNENLAVYLTSSQALWITDLSGGKVNLSSVTVPTSVTAFTLTLTHYNTWNSQFDTFTKLGFGYLGANEPFPNETLLEVDRSSASDAASLASALDQKFALNFAPFTQLTNSSTFAFVSPMDFTTELHVYFWKMLPSSAGGFAKIVTESALESSNFAFFGLSYASSTYSLSYGAISPLSNPSSFSLFNQLGVSGLNYSSSAASSAVEVHVLGGLVTNSTSKLKWNNNAQNFSSTFTESKTSSSNLTVSDIAGSLDFSFPTIIAYRQVSPLEAPAGSNVSVSITVKNVSPPGTPSASVAFNDSAWYTGLSHSGSSAANYTLSSGTSNTTVYFVKAPSTSTNIFLPATPVTYSFKAANLTIKQTSFLNNETMLVAPASAPAALEAIANVNSPSITSGQPLSLTVQIKNWGSGPAANVVVPGQSPVNIASLASSNFTVTATPIPGQVTAVVGYLVSWTDSAGSHTVGTNSFPQAFGLGNPGSPSLTLSKNIVVSTNKKTANVTLVLTNGGSNSLTNLNITDPLPPGINFSSSVGNRTISFSNGAARATLANLSASASVNYTYTLKISNPTDNYVFLPGNVSTDWNGLTVTHYSQGQGIALGVTASKSIFPNAGFQGTTVVEHLGVHNNGSLPVYQVTFTNTLDPFLSYLNSSKGTTALLSSGGSINTTLKVNMTGSPGTYNSSASAASFLFAGANQTASSNVFPITIYEDVFASMQALGPKIEESHVINVSVTISNPSNATVSDVNLALKLPPYLQLNSGALSVNIPTLGPKQNVTKYFAVSANIPFSYTISGGNLTFQYQSRTLKGVTNPLTLNIVDDLTLRYGIWIVLGFLIVIGTLVYVRRLVHRPVA